jgi:hypothetical protein
MGDRVGAVRDLTEAGLSEPAEADRTMGFVVGCPVWEGGFGRRTVAIFAGAMWSH